MSPLDAAHAVVMDYPGGSESLAPRIGKVASTLRQELKPPPGSSAKLALMDAVKISVATDDARIVEAFNEACGFCPPLPLPRGECDTGTLEELLDRGAKLSSAVSDAFAEFQSDIKDGQVTPNELAKFENRALEAISAVVVLARSMRAKMEADRAARMHVDAGAR